MFDFLYLDFFEDERFGRDYLTESFGVSGNPFNGIKVGLLY
jgi:hypothetical protein